MKNLFPLTVLAALAASGISQAQTPAYSKPSGYVTQQLEPGFNLVGLTLQNSPVFSGAVSSVSGETITFGSDLSGVLPSGRTFLLEVNTGGASGVVQDFNQVSGSSITVPAAIAGLAATDQVSMRIAPTLEEIFGTTLQSQANAGGSDIVWLPSGAGQYELYYKQTPFFGDPVWKKLGPNNTETDAPGTSVFYLEGMFVQVKSVAKPLTLTGTVKTTPSKFSIVSGFNLVGSNFPVGTNLVNSGLQDTLQSQANAGGSDLVWVSNSPGVFTRYYYQTPFFGDKSWVRVDEGGETTVDGSTIPLSSGVFIQRKSGPIAITLTPPTSYSSL